MLLNQVNIWCIVVAIIFQMIMDGLISSWSLLLTIFGLHTFSTSNSIWFSSTFHWVYLFIFDHIWWCYMNNSLQLNMSIDSLFQFNNACVKINQMLTFLTEKHCKICVFVFVAMSDANDVHQCIRWACYSAKNSQMSV